MSDDVAIRTEEPGDHARTYEIVRSAFDSRVQADLVEALREAAEPSLSLVALAGDDLVGHIFFSPVTFASATAAAAAQLSPVSVAPSMQRRGIGSSLIRSGLAGCRDLGWSSVFLVGNPLYYARFGFEMAGPRGLSCPGPHGPFLQVLELERGALAGTTGLVRFHPAYDAIEEG